MYSPDESKYSIPVRSVTLEGSNLKFTVYIWVDNIDATDAMKATYEGKISTDGASIDGTLTTRVGPHPLALRRATKETTWPKKPPPAVLTLLAADATAGASTSITVHDGRITIINNSPALDIDAMDFFYVIDGQRRYQEPVIDTDRIGPLVKAGSIITRPLWTLKPGEEARLQLVINGVAFSDGTTEGPNKWHTEMFVTMRDQMYRGEVVMIGDVPDRGDSRNAFNLLSTMYKALPNALPVRSAPKLTADSPR